MIAHPFHSLLGMRHAVGTDRPGRTDCAARNHARAQAGCQPRRLGAVFGSVPGSRTRAAPLHLAEHGWKQFELEPGLDELFPLSQLDEGGLVHGHRGMSQPPAHVQEGQVARDGLSDLQHKPRPHRFKARHHGTQSKGRQRHHHAARPIDMAETWAVVPRRVRAGVLITEDRPRVVGDVMVFLRVCFRNKAIASVSGRRAASAITPQHVENARAPALLHAPDVPQRHAAALFVA
mmetsp:Transcript_4290/g.14117  ORF Transcript_4290/g.14117 Transcript_4290/m.14117 type:complete len:234 (-) Transcript_4290:106-807(-)